MGRLDKGSKPTRAERKAEKKAARAAAKEAEFDAREMAKEEKRAAKASRPRWGRRKAAAELDELDQGASGFEYNEPSRGFGAFTPSGRGRSDELDRTFPEADRDYTSVSPALAPDYQPATRAPREARPLGGSRPQPAHPGISPMDQQPTPFYQDAGRPETVAPWAEDAPDPEPQRRSMARRIFGKKAARDSTGTSRSDPALSPVSQQGTQIRSIEANASPASLSPPAGSQMSPADSFAALRHAASGPGVQGGQAARLDLDNVLVLDDPVVEPGGSGSAPLSSSSDHHVAPQDVASMAAVSRVEHQRSTPPSSGFSENWLGLWVSEDGEAVFIEEDGDGWFAVTVLPDPTTTCYSGPDYPEIQSYRMPASWSQESVGEFDGERLAVITVPGLPDTHRSPMMYIYFLTSIPVADGGGSRFATPDDPTRRVFIAADFEPGSVNPWSDRDDIEWIDPSVHYYKAPGKLDAYMMRRMAKDDPLN